MVDDRTELCDRQRAYLHPSVRERPVRRRPFLVHHDMTNRRTARRRVHPSRPAGRSGWSRGRRHCRSPREPPRRIRQPLNQPLRDGGASVEYPSARRKIQPVRKAAAHGFGLESAQPTLPAEVPRRACDRGRSPGRPSPGVGRPGGGRISAFRVSVEGRIEIRARRGCRPRLGSGHLGREPDRAKAVHTPPCNGRHGDLPAAAVRVLGAGRGRRRRRLRDRAARLAHFRPRRGALPARDP